MDIPTILIIVNLSATLVYPIFKMISRIRRSSCCGMNVEIDPSSSKDEQPKTN